MDSRSINLTPLVPYQKMKNLYNPFILIASSLLLLLFQSCSKTELPTTTLPITSARVIVSSANDSKIDTFQYIDWDGSKPNLPVLVDTIRLLKNTNYTIRLVMLNEASNPIQNYSDTVLAQADSYQLEYLTAEGSQGSAYKLLDKDTKGLPLGLESQWRWDRATRSSMYLALRQSHGTKNGTDGTGAVIFSAQLPIVVK